jgi:DNA repair and recombination protein RAD54B
LRKKAQLAALGEWTHINGLRRGARDGVQDDILQSLMYEFGPKQPQPSSLDALLAIGLATATSSFDSSEMPVNRVPGGTISFIFEKFSTTIEKENVGEPEDDNSS